MKIAYFECTAGISGDMVLGAMLDAGLGLDALRAELAKLRLPEFEIRAGKVERHGISATRAEVEAREGHVHRNLADVLAVIQNSDLDPELKTRAADIFRRLAEAEAHVHGTTPDDVHFHEVGAVDALVDIVGAVVGLDLLGVECVYGSKLRFGTGQTRAAHGMLPIPVPAVVALCRGIPAERTDIPFEMVTPTGAAIITTLARAVGEPITFRTESVGYGAGARDPQQVPNLLRLEIGDADDVPASDSLVVIETNIDDMSPEIYPYLIDRLLSGGARDAFLTPVVMKKGRPGTQVTVLADPAGAKDLVDLVLRETTTLGVRVSSVDRVVLPRESASVDTRYGPIQVKVAHLHGEARVTPEYEDCARVARENNSPLLDVYREASRAADRAGISSAGQ